MDFELRDKTALVTGGARGIGAAICRGLVAEGCRVVFLDRNREAGEALAAELGCGFLAVDLTDEAACRAAMVRGLDGFDGRLDVLVHNAGVNDGAGLDAGPAAFLESLHRNLLHVYHLTHLAAEALARARGAVVLVSSKVASTGQGGTSGYAAAKGAINGLTREWAVDLAPRGVRVNTVCPAEVWTPMYADWLASLDDGEAVRKDIESLVPLGQRFTTEQEIADTAVFLASPRSSHTTGQILFVDGGYTHLDRKVRG